VIQFLTSGERLHTVRVTMKVLAFSWMPRDYVRGFKMIFDSYSEHLITIRKPAPIGALLFKYCVHRR